MNLGGNKNGKLNQLRVEVLREQKEVLLECPHFWSNPEMPMGEDVSVESPTCPQGIKPSKQKGKGK